MATGEETAELLARLEVFSELEERELREVAQLAVPRSYERGEVIFREGDTGDTCYVIRSGSVSVMREHQDGRVIALAELRAGAMFGELSMFGGETRSATVETLEPTRAVALLAADFQRLLRSHPEIAVKMLNALADRLREANARLLQEVENMFSAFPALAVSVSNKLTTTRCVLSEGEAL